MLCDFRFQCGAINKAHADEDVAEGLPALELCAQQFFQATLAQEAEFYGDLTERTALFGLNAEDFEDLSHGQAAGLYGELTDGDSSLHLLVQRAEHLLRRDQSSSYQIIA